MPLPPLTPLQFVVLEALLDGDRPGREIRDHLASRRIKKSGPAFYQMMARLEDAKFVNGRYDEKVIGGQMIRERHYQLLRDGVKAYRETVDFYRDPVLANEKRGIGYAR